MKLSNVNLQAAKYQIGSRQCLFGEPTTTLKMHAINIYVVSKNHPGWTG